MCFVALPKKRSKHFRDSAYLILGADTEMLLVTHSQVLWGGQGANFKKGKNSIPSGDLSDDHAITWQ